MTFSKLVSSTHFTDKYNGRNGNPICKITPHHMAGVMSGAACGAYLQSTPRQASANYCIGVNGDIDCEVEEENRAWTSSSWDNDKNAITIECSDCDGNWNISDATFNALVELCADICQRYGFSLNYDGTPNGSLTEHRMFANTDCPGEPFHNRFPELAEKVNARLGVSPAPAQPSTDASIEELAQEVIAGAFGNGDERRAALGSNYDAVQARVNEILSGGSSAVPSADIDALANAVIAGQYGNGEDRKNALGDNYDAVQARVNEILSGGSTSAPSVDIESLAQAVIHGDYGNGEDRKNALGDNYDAVQARVNEILSGNHGE